jgi:hypothetical protein
MRAVGLFLLLAGSLVLLWPLYGRLLHALPMTRSDSQLYGGMMLLAGVVVLVISRARTS